MLLNIVWTVLPFIRSAHATCSSHLLIDDFTRWSSSKNNLGRWTSDDGSMKSISASNGTLTLISKASSYFYETFPCQEATTQGYNALSFFVEGPPGGSFKLQTQTRSSCSHDRVTRTNQVIAGLTGSLQTITAPLSSFTGANLEAITAFVWYDFTETQTAWNISNIQLTFLYYNAMLDSSSDDGTMKSVVVGCQNTDIYGGISLRIKAPAGTTFNVQLSSPLTCGGDDAQTATRTAAELGWIFDGTEKPYTIPFSKFTGFDKTKLSTIMFTGLSTAVTLGPIAFYCGSTAVDYVVPSAPFLSTPTLTVPAPSSTVSPFVIDLFRNKDTNALGLWHGADEDPGMTLTFTGNRMVLQSTDADLGWYSQVSSTCADLRQYAGSYLHIAYSGSNKFSVALQQHNSQCNENIQPYPETWDSLEAARYATASDVYMPLSHFNIELSRVIGVALKGFYTTDATVFTKIEIVSSIPVGFNIPNKLPSGNLVFACKRPNSFAFAIDDGDPKLAKQVTDIVKAENINVTFFTVGAPLEDPTTNLSAVYKEMMARGHQIALHSFTHPKMEGLASDAAIDWEYSNDVAAVKNTFGGFHTPYFRPPFGTEGARMRQRLAAALGTDDPYLVMWSVDVEDWLWAESATPEKQLEAFKRDLAKGGNLVVMHYLYPTTVGYLRQFIQLAKATGKQLMRVDQCMMDPNAPPL
ncbi:Chitin deacetylase [Pleurostoma richardsiae]|uniref:Chitin deacetylase n=1 Tax=Pleurostoma richardsiae TaxID=41990 RepID=A0AA38RPW1_9PEZI|nr:Chitin deacetylase [Pleurostoma richardsiae]